MKKVLLAASVLTMAFATQGYAASANSSYCSLGKLQRNLPSWNEEYGCLNTPARHAFATAPRPQAIPVGATTANEYCTLAKYQRNLPSWNETYGCLRR
ncbi:MAG: hypothetical protein J0H89_05045 [Rhizobiales bacterium]|jgi:hypothetical protein|nr:hypothetical protein [Hyphomicrobiales bacterium]